MSSGGRPAIGNERPVVMPDEMWAWLGDIAKMSTDSGNRSEIARRCIAYARRMQDEDPAGFYRAIMDPPPPTT